MIASALLTASARVTVKPVPIPERRPKFSSPAPPGWVGCLDDGVMDALVFHAGQPAGGPKVAVRFPNSANNSRDQAPLADAGSFSVASEIQLWPPQEHS